MEEKKLRKRKWLFEQLALYFDKENEGTVTERGMVGGGGGCGVAVKWSLVQARRKICNIARGVLINRVGQSKRELRSFLAF